jgi:hypothetical protein
MHMPQVVHAPPERVTIQRVVTNTPTLPDDLQPAEQPIQCWRYRLFVISWIPVDTELHRDVALAETTSTPPPWKFCDDGARVD